MVLDISSGTWEVLTSGVVKVDIGSINNRGLLPHTPYTHDATLMSDHNANTKVIISNNARFYSRFRRICSEATQVYNEVVAGATNTFTLANVPVLGTQRIYGNGQRLTPTVDYTIADDVITTISSWSAGQILADYNY